jgi:hypothetical protein
MLDYELELLAIESAVETEKLDPAALLALRCRGVAHARLCCSLLCVFLEAIGACRMVFVDYSRAL